MSYKVRYFFCLLYEMLSIITCWFLTTFVYLYINEQANTLFLQVLLWITPGIYLVYCWAHGGQTLAMKAWKLKLIMPRQKCNLKFYLMRYCLSTISVAFFCIGYFYIFFDKKNRYLHDRALGSEIIDVQI